MRFQVSVILMFLVLPFIMEDRSVRKELDPVNIVQIWRINRAYTPTEFPRLKGFRPRFTDSVKVDGHTIAYSIRYDAKNVQAWSFICDLDADQYREFRLQRMYFTREAKDPDSVLMRMVQRVRQELGTLVWKEDHPDSMTFRWEWIPRTTHQLLLRKNGTRVEMSVSPRT